ncbi:MAG: hypothetical protein ABI181_07510 [Mycobacteriaceae bacterium]
MARGDHPMRTPFYGVLLIAGAMVGATVAQAQAPLWLQVVVYVVAVPAALVGFVLTLRDYGR